MFTDSDAADKRQEATKVVTAICRLG